MSLLRYLLLIVAVLGVPWRLGRLRRHLSASGCLLGIVGLAAGFVLGLAWFVTWVEYLVLRVVG